MYTEKLTNNERSSAVIESGFLFDLAVFSAFRDIVFH